MESNFPLDTFILEITMRNITLAVALLTLHATVAEAGLAFGEFNRIDYNNRENVIDANGTPLTLDAGDRIEGIVFANEINGDSNNDDITGVFDLTVAFVLDAATESAVADPTTFSGFAYVLLRPTNTTGPGGAGRLGDFEAGTAFALFTNNRDDVTTELGRDVADYASVSDARDAVFDEAMDGPLVGSFGFGAVAADGAAAFDDPSDWGAAGNGYWYAYVEYTGGVTDPSAAFYYGLEALGGPVATVGPGPNPLPNAVLPSLGLIPDSATDIEENRLGGSTLFDFTGKGDQFANNQFNDSINEHDEAKFPLASNDPAFVHPAPEPSSLALLGLGALCGVPALRRRKKGVDQAA